MPADWIDLRDVGRREVAPVIYQLLADVIGADRRLRRQGHKFYLYCPCGDPQGRIRVDGTPQNPDRQARRIRSQAAHCPNDHGLDR
ncbi:MAG TPA: hypothetical protein VES02_02470 [Dermatophilaceae bacterium]|nr:hypothetical protein [Dermatophilaceae bacterium]